jgi:hypothetical protein
MFIRESCITCTVSCGLFVNWTVFLFTVCILYCSADSTHLLQIHEANMNTPFHSYYIVSEKNGNSVPQIFPYVSKNAKSFQFPFDSTSWRNVESGVVNIFILTVLSSYRKCIKRKNNAEDIHRPHVLSLKALHKCLTAVRKGSYQAVDTDLPTYFPQDLF